MRVTSSLGEGTKIEFYLYQCLDDLLMSSASQMKLTSESLIEGGGSHPSETFQDFLCKSIRFKLRILIVDDVPYNIHALRI